MGNVNFLGVCCKYSTEEKKQIKKFPDCMEDNFLTQLVGEGAPLHLLFINREDGGWGHSNYEMIEFSVLGKARKEVSRTAILDFQREDFGLFRDLVDRVPWEAVLKGKGFQEG